MIKSKIRLFVLFGFWAATATPDFSMIGFAATNGRTTGGAGGEIVAPTTLAELKRYAENPAVPYVILITKEFNTGISVTIGPDGAIASGGTSTTYGDVIRVGSNKTLVGIGTSGFFNRVGIVIQNRSNIIIRNIVFTMKDVPIARTNENKIIGWVNGTATPIADPDCIGIQADEPNVPEADQRSEHIWIDHCEFYNEDPKVMTDVDRYDGLLDGKNNSTNMTVSWCYFHDHHKATLMGHGDSDKYDRRITYHHNYFKNISSRVPLIRYGQAHLLNNYLADCENGANARIDSDLYIEGNHFSSCKKPVFGKVSENGAATLADNRWEGCSRVPSVVLSQAAGADPLSESEEILPGSFRPSSAYSYSADRVASVASIVPAYAGVGKISTGEYERVNLRISEKEKIDRYSLKSKNRRFCAQARPGTTARLYSINGTVRSSIATTHEMPFSGGEISSGFYILKSGDATISLPVK